MKLQIEIAGLFGFYRFAGEKVSHPLLFSLCYRGVRLAGFSEFVIHRQAPKEVASSELGLVA